MMQFLRTKMMPSILSFVLSVVASTTAARAATPFFWDDFDRDVLQDGNVDWGLYDGEAYLDDGNLILQPIDSADELSHVDIRTTLPPVGDFAIRTQVRFGGNESPGEFQWIGPISSKGWGGVTGAGWVSVGEPLVDGQILDGNQIFENDVYLLYESIGEQVSIRAWVDGTEKPTEPQFVLEREVSEASSFGMHYNPWAVPSVAPRGRFGVVRYYAVLPAVTGDFSASDTLDLEDINLIDQELRGESRNRVFDLNDDALVTGEDRRLLIKDLIGTWYGDSNLDGEFNTADLVTVFQAGEYEDRIADNSSWSTGDWNGDADFDTSDLVFAFQDGGFEQGPIAAVNAVPEPAAGSMLAIGLIALVVNKRRRGVRD